MTTLRGSVSVFFVLAATLAWTGPESVDGAPSSERTALSSDSTITVSGFLPPIPGPLPFFYDLFTFRTDGGGTTVIAAIAVPVGKLRRERNDGRVRYQFDVRLVLADTARHSVVHSVDSAFVNVERPLSGQHLLHTYIEIQAPPSPSSLQRVIVTDAARPGVGQLYNEPFPIPDYSGPELMLSDIAFGLPDATDGWARRGNMLALLPTSQFPESSFDVYYEIYNLPKGTPYETEILIEPLDDSGDGEGSVRAFFSGESEAREDDSVAELRRVDSALPKGPYRFTVTVRNMADGTSTSSSRAVEVRGWRGGTTMVPAMPRGLGQ